MENKEILRILKSDLKVFEDTTISQQTILSMTPNDVAGALNIIEFSLSKLIANAQEQNKDDVASNLTDNQILFLHYFLTELSQNFFPMAHNQAPLENQRIVCTEIPNIFSNKLYAYLDDLNNMLERLNEHLIPSNQLFEFIDKLHHMQQISERLKETNEAIQDFIPRINHVVGND